MSLAADRAQAIAEAIGRDGIARRIFLMPREAFTCRVVAVRDDWDEIMAWVREHAEAEVGGVATLSGGRMWDMAPEIEDMLWRALAFHGEQQRAQVIDSTGSA